LVTHHTRSDAIPFSSCKADGDGVPACYGWRGMTSDAGEYEYAIPPAASTIEALRGIGYSLVTAIADLVDNSITAGARTIWLNFWWAGRESRVTILDDGAGMSEAGLSEAMRLGSRNPLEARDERDLGRFGLGLKTASFSQCRRLTVATKQLGGDRAVRQWDLDYVLQHNEWRVLKRAPAGSEGHLVALNGLHSGTLILWEKLDQLVGDVSQEDEHARLIFLRAAETLREHLGMVFHRFLGDRRPELRIFINGNGDEHRVTAWDPFLEDNPATIHTPEDEIRIGDCVVRIKGFVLPHKDKLGDEAHKEASGSAGWNAQQGFYVYRNRRLLVAGSWLGLGAERPWTKEEHYKLARLRLDLPNSMDAQWQIDVRKSVARPPAIIRGRLRQLAEGVRRRAREVFSYRGQYQPRAVSEPLMRAWVQVQNNGRIGYRINRDHSLIAQCLAQQETSREMLGQVLRVVEATVPVQKIWLDMAEHPDAHGTAGDRLSESAVLAVMRELYAALRISHGLSHDAAVRQLLCSEPFNHFPHLAEALGNPNQDSTQ
jgi:hypothetical protein